MGALAGTYPHWHQAVPNRTDLAPEALRRRSTGCSDPCGQLGSIPAFFVRKQFLFRFGSGWCCRLEQGAGLFVTDRFAAMVEGGGHVGPYLPTSLYAPQAVGSAAARWVVDKELVGDIDHGLIANEVCVHAVHIESIADVDDPGGLAQESVVVGAAVAAAE